MAGVLQVTGQQELLERSPMLARSIKLRNPYVDALHLAQIALLRRYRALPADAPADERAPLLDAIHHSINGIAAGLQTTVGDRYQYRVISGEGSGSVGRVQWSVLNKEALPRGRPRYFLCSLVTRHSPLVTERGSGSWGRRFGRAILAIWPRVALAPQRK